MHYGKHGRANPMNRVDKVFWAIIVIIAAAYAALFVDGIMNAEAIEPEQPQEIACESEPTNVETITVDEFMDKAREAWESVTAQPEEEQEEEEYVEEYYYEPVYYGGYTGGSTATSMHDLVNGQGRAYDEDGTSYTYYYDCVGDLDIPGEYKDSDGVSYDEDGYIVVASSDYEKGTVIETPYGDARVWDTGCASGTVDIYVG